MIPEQRRSLTGGYSAVNENIPLLCEWLNISSEVPQQMRDLHEQNGEGHSTGENEHEQEYHSSLTSRQSNSEHSSTTRNLSSAGKPQSTADEKCLAMSFEEANYVEKYGPWHRLDRWKLYRYWVGCHCQHQLTQVKQLTNDYNKLVPQMNDFRLREDLEVRNLTQPEVSVLKRRQRCMLVYSFRIRSTFCWHTSYSSDYSTCLCRYELMSMFHVLFRM